MNPDPADLRKLHDIVVPDAVPWWPPAPGWIVVFVVVLGIALVMSIRRFRAWKSDAYRRAALRELEAADSIPRIAEVLRRSALAIAPRETIAALQGEEWTRWLADRLTNPIPADVAAVLAGSVYDPQHATADPDGLRRFARDWLRHHVRPC